MDQQRQDGQLEPTYNRSVPIQDVALKISREQWTIETGGKRVSGISVLMVRPDDDDDDVSVHRHIGIYIYIYIYTHMYI